jgi:hypothetical protein
MRKVKKEKNTEGKGPSGPEPDKSEPNAEKKVFTGKKARHYDIVEETRRNQAERRLREETDARFEGDLLV